jgi:hypothetical protein
MIELASQMTPSKVKYTLFRRMIYMDIVLHLILYMGVI